MTDTTPLPGALQAAWGLRERPTKGPKPALSAERIVEAAVRVAQAEGYPAVSMNRVAAELSTSAMSLYRHVANKDELAILMMEAAAGEPPPSVPGEPWRPALERWAWAMHDLFREHRWFLQIPLEAPPATPRQLSWVEAGLTVLAGTALDEAEKLSVVLLVNGVIRNQALLTGQMTEAARSAGRTIDATMSEFGGLLRVLVTAERFPMLRRAIDAGVMDRADDPEAEFAFGLARILDGVAMLLAARAAGVEPA
jgi:AcrR family transcriptional regulator